MSNGAAQCCANENRNAHAEIGACGTAAFLATPVNVFNLNAQIPILVGFLIELNMNGVGTLTGSTNLAYGPNCSLTWLPVNLAACELGSWIQRCEFE